MSELGLPEHHAHSGGLDIKGALTKKIGPMPGYAWLGIVLVLAYGYHWYTGRNVGSAVVDTSGNTGIADTSGAAAGVGGGAAYTGTGVADTSGTATGLGGGQVTVGPAATYTVANPPSGTKFIFNRANGTVYEVWPDGTEMAVTAVEYAALGKPAYTSTGTAPAAAKYNPLKPGAGVKYGIDYNRNPVGQTVQITADGVEHNLSYLNWQLLGKPTRTIILGHPAVAAKPKAVAKPAAKVAAKPAAKPKAVAKPAPRTYVVKSGDSLFSIAQHYYGNGNQYPKIASANHIANPNLIHAGTRLVIPT